MRRILKIAKVELSILIYSPVIWIVLPIFLVLCGLGLLDMLQQTKTVLALGAEQTNSITETLFGGNYGLFTRVQQTLYLYLPILTMSLMSRETSSGSIKLLFSSPVKLTEIILGKYLAIVTLGLAFVAILALYAGIGIYTIKDADAGRLAAGLFGLFLLIATYAAIGLFMSCLTNYQIVAAITTLAVFAALRFVGGIGQSIDFVRDLTYFLSISGRTDTMVAGLISTKDVCYYLIISALFLALCVLYLKNQRELRSWGSKAARYIAVVALALLCGYLTSRSMFTGYLDLTAGRTMTISEPGQETAKKIRGKLKITTYVNLLSPNMFQFMPDRRNADLQEQERYKRFIPWIENEYVYYYHDLVDTAMASYKFNPRFKKLKNIREIAEKTALSADYNIRDFLTPEQIGKVADLQPEGYYQVRKLEYQGKSTWLRFFVMDADQYAYEPEWMAAIKRLTDEKPRIVFLTGSNEAGITDKDDRGYRQVLSNSQRRSAMVNQGFDVDTVNADSQDLPANTAVLVIADPTIPFTAAAEQKLIRFIDSGGNLLITTNPGRQEVINPLLGRLGLKVLPGMLVKPDKDLAKNKINVRYTSGAADIDPYVPMILAAKPAITLKGVSALSYAANGPFRIRTLVQSPDGGWNKVQPFDVSTPVLTFSAAAGDQQGSFPVTVALTRNIHNKEQRIIVSGDADQFSNAEFSDLVPAVKTANTDIVFRWLSYGKFPFAATRPAIKDLDISASKERIALIGVICKFILPAILIIAGMIILLRRRRN